MKNAAYKAIAPKIVLATAGPSVGSFIDPIMVSWFVLNKNAITDKITIPNADITVQNQALAGCNRGKEREEKRGRIKDC